MGDGNYHGAGSYGRRSSPRRYDYDERDDRQSWKDQQHSYSHGAGRDDRHRYQDQDRNSYRDSDRHYDDRDQGSGWRGGSGHRGDDRYRRRDYNMSDREHGGGGRREHDYSDMYDEPAEGDNDGWDDRNERDYDRRDSPRRGGDSYRRHRDYEDDGRRDSSYHAPLKPRRPALTGETDECPQQVPSTTLIIRGLERQADEQVLYKGVMKLFKDAPSQKDSAPSLAKPNLPKLKSTAPSANTSSMGADPKSLARIHLIRGREYDESWRYGFAEFDTVADAEAAVRKFNASNNFTISSQPVEVAFIHAGVFIPSIDHGGSDESPFSFESAQNPQLRLRYWDDRAYSSIYVIPREPKAAPEDSTLAEGQVQDKVDDGADAGGKKSKKPKDKTAVPMVAMAPQMSMWNKKRAEIHGGSAGIMHADSPGDFSDRSATGPRAPHKNDIYTSYAYKDNTTFVCFLCSKKFENNTALVYHETTNSEHLKALDDNDKIDHAVKLLSSIGISEPRQITLREPRSRSELAPEYKSYADQENLICYLCKAQFTNVRVMRLHERESVLHREKLTDEAQVQTAIDALAKLGLKPVIMRPAPFDAGYRDRAMERRSAFNQPKQPGAAPKRKRPGTEVAPREEPKPAPKPKLSSKAMQMMENLGWKAGQGLGAEGTGRTEAVATELYRPGVGLGAEGGKVGDAAEEAAKKTVGGGTSYGERMQQAKERMDRS